MARKKIEPRDVEIKEVEITKEIVDKFTCTAVSDITANINGRVILASGGEILILNKCEYGILKDKVTI